MADSSARFTKLNAFVDRGQAQLRRAGCGSAAALWLTLWRFENADTDSARVGLNTLAECFGTDKRNVARMLAQLEEHGYLSTLEAGKPGRGATAVYRLLVPIEKVSPAHLSGVEKGVISTPIPAEKIGVTVTPIHEEKVSPEHEKGVTVTPVQKQKKNKDISANAGEGIEKTAAKEKMPRPRDALFDAIAEVTGAAPKAAGSHIGAVRKALAGEEPPFTPEEVREFGRRFWELCPWAKQDNRQRPELGELQKHIGKVRTAKKPPPTEPKGFIDFGTQPSARKESVA